VQGQGGGKKLFPNPDSPANHLKKILPLPLAGEGESERGRGIPPSLPAGNEEDLMVHFDLFLTFTQTLSTIGAG